jgi:hypothetical protein
MSAQADILFFTTLAATYVKRADDCHSPVLAAGLRQLAAGYLEIARHLDADHGVAPVSPAAAVRRNAA